MKTKTTLISATAFTVGALSAPAQGIHSSNGTYYVDVLIPHGLSCLGNPLLASDNSMNGLFFSGTNQVANPWLGATFYLWSGTGFIGVHDDTYGGGCPLCYYQLLPGTGFFAYNSGLAFTNTFAGALVQTPFTNRIGAGFSLVSSGLPLATNVVQLGLNAQPGDTIYTWSGSGFLGYHLDTYGAGWGSSPPPAPQADVTNGPFIHVAEGFFISNGSLAPYNWVQNFTVH